MTQSTPYPRVLVLAANEITANFSTGITVRNLFEDWPSDRLAQVCMIAAAEDEGALTHNTQVLRGQGGLVDPPVRWALQRVRSGGRGRQAGPSHSLAAPPPDTSGQSRASIRTLLELAPVRIDGRTLRLVEDFQPEVIYAPLSGLRMMKLALRLQARTGAHLVPHFMDDWPATLYAAGGLGGVPRRIVTRKLDSVLRSASGVAVISEAMALEYRSRYGVDSVALMNCVDHVDDAGHSSTSDTVRFVYVGGLHLGRDAILRKLADVIGQTKGAELQIHAPDADLIRIGPIFAGLERVEVGPNLRSFEVGAVLRSADVLVHVESFGAKTANYTRLSISTKIPQYLAAGRPILAIGPTGIASMEHLRQSKAAHLVTDSSLSDLHDVVRGLAADPALRDGLGSAGSRFAQRHHFRPIVVERLRALLRSAADGQNRA